MSTVSESALPGLTPARANDLAISWNDGGIWEDVLWLARRCWLVESEVPLSLRWHHLVLAVGNFKRQGGRRLRPSSISGNPLPPVSRSQLFTMPCGRKIHREEEDSWRVLEARLPGAALATTTTLLAALWPSDHFVFDWRVEAAANALRINANLKPTRWALSELSGGKRPSPDFSDYSEVRSWLRTVKGTQLVTLERALYRLSQQVPTVKGRGWTEYGRVVATHLEGSIGPKLG
jgi:hypothetical protein